MRSVHVRFAMMRELSRKDLSGERWLGSLETLELSRHRHYGRRMEWLVGRLIVKRLIAEVIAECAGEMRVVDILSQTAEGRSTRPTVFVHGQRRPWALSISHTDAAVGIAFSTIPGTLVGVDLVRLQSFGPGFLETWFAPSEQPSLRALGSRAVSWRWAAKEALYKACNTGEPFVPRRIVFDERPTRARWIYHGSPLHGHATLRYMTRCDHVMALAVLAPSDSLSVNAQPVFAKLAGQTARKWGERK